MRPRKPWLLDHRAYTQITETRRMLDARLREEPDDFMALALADVFAELDPEREPGLRCHARRAHELRGRLGATSWQSRARDLGLDIVLFNLCAGLHRADFGHAALPVLARRATEVTINPRILALLRDYMRELGERDVITAIDSAIARRAPALAIGRIERAFVPALLLDHAAVAVRFHPSGHLAAVRIRGDRRTSGTLTLEPAPGTAHLVYTAHTGGSGYVVDEHYRDGAIHGTYNSPWHDGTESREPRDWACWVAEALASLEGIVPALARKSA